MRRMGTGALALAIGLTTSAAFGGVQGPRELDATIRAELGAEDYQITQLQLDPVLGQPFFTVFEIGDQTYTMDLRPHSVRSDHFQVLVAGAGGVTEEVEAPPIGTYRGELVEVPGSEVNASIVDGTLRAIVRFDAENVFEMVSLSEVVDGGARDLYVVTDVMDLIPDGSICANELIEGMNEPRDLGHDHGAHEVFEGGEGGPGIDEVMMAEIAFDADVEFYNRNGQSVDNTVADIESVLNAMNDIYERDCEIVHEITTIIVRTGEPDPYTTSDPGSLLEQFRNEWNRNQSGVPRDLAHLMTGKNLNGGVIGIAYLGVVCARSSAYGLAESKYTSSFSRRVALSAHEIGHNWNAGHCSSNCNTGSDCRIMCPCLGGCSRDVTRFGTVSRNAITNFRNSRTCLDPFGGFRIDSGTLIGGENADFFVTGAEPNAEVRAYYSLRGTGSCFIPDFNVTLDLQNCQLGLTGTTDANGEEQWTTRLPRVNQIRLIWIQAAQNGAISELYLTQINP